MSNKVKDIDIKPHMLLFQWCCPYENFDPNNIKIDEKSYKDILIMELDV